MLRDMKLTDQDKKEMAEESILDRANYPHGLMLHLDADAIKKLEMKKPSVGQKVKIIAMAEIDSVSKAKERGDEGGFSVSIQITDMEVEEKEKEESDDKSFTDAFYGGDGGNQS